MDQIEVMLDNVDRAYMRGVINERERDEAIDAIIADAHRCVETQE